MSHALFPDVGRRAVLTHCFLLMGALALPALKAGAAEPTSGRLTSSSDDQVTGYINSLIRQGWTDNQITQSKPATDNEWVRRVYLDVLGRIPSVEEAEAFIQDKTPQKKRNLLNKLLHSDTYVEEYARNWTTIWTNILIGRTGGTGRRTMVSRDGMQQYLRRCFLRDTPYDQMIFELISANGANKPGTEGYNGAVNFLLDNLAEKATPATAKVAKIFLGVQVQCTQCHNHPFNNSKQSAFWGMNAFFRQTKALRTMQGRDIVSVRLEDESFAGESGNPAEADIFYELRNGILKVAYPTFIDETTINPSGYLEDVNRRDELAKLVQKSPLLAKALVNRMWSHFLGYGFTKPIDDMGPHNPPTHPELLDRLAKDFATYGYDLKTLIKWIALSEPYSLSSQFNGEKNKYDDPSLGERPLFSHFYLRQMSAEQLYESLLVATEAAKGRGSYQDQEKLKSKWLQQFSVAFGTDENDETTTFNGTIPQTLMMWNGELIRKATTDAKGGMIHRVASSGKSGQMIDYLYMATLGRDPTTSEVGNANKAFRNRKGNALEAMQDVFWVLLNSNEFILQH